VLGNNTQHLASKADELEADQEFGYGIVFYGRRNTYSGQSFITLRVGGFNPGV
jgi:hypothetical protein